MPHLHGHIDAVVQFTIKYGAGPVLPELNAFYSGHASDVKLRTDPAFWTALAAFPDGFAWAAIAVAKDNLSSDKADLF